MSETVLRRAVRVAGLALSGWSRPSAMPPRSPHALAGAHGLPMATDTAARLSLLLAALFVIYGVNATYLPVWLDSRGLSAGQIALATSAPTFLRLLSTPTIAFWADRAQAHRQAVQALSLGALLLLVTLVGLRSPVAIEFTVVALLIAVQSMMPLVDALTMRASREQGLDYGRVRSWGSVTFVLGSYLAGYLAATRGAGSVVWVLLAGALLTAVAARTLPPPAAGRRNGAAAITWRDLVALVTTPRFALFLFAAGAIQSAHALFYVFGVLHWRKQGLSDGFIGSLWAIGVIAEIVLLRSARRIGVIGPERLIVIGAVAGIVRWTAMAFDPPVALLPPLQVLHAATYAATHLGCMLWIARFVPESHAGSAQAMLSTATAGVGTGCAILLSGWLYPAFGGGGYLGMALLCVAGTVAALALTVLPSSLGSMPRDRP